MQLTEKRSLPLGVHRLPSQPGNGSERSAADESLFQFLLRRFKYECENDSVPQVQRRVGAGVHGRLEPGGGSRVSNWVEGAPEKSVWHGTNVPAEKCVPVGTFRCSTCGFLESYALPEFAAK
jgi:hypothetical protein